MILSLYLPCVIASIILLFMEDKENIFDLRIKKTPASQFFILNVCNIIASGIGYCINFKILKKFYSFNDFDYIRWSGFSLSKFEELVNNWLEYYGFIAGENLLGHRAVRHNLICAFLIFLTIIAIVYAIKKGNIYFKCLALIYCMAILISALLYLTTEMGITSRYLFPYAILFIPLLACLFHATDRKIRYLALIVGEVLIISVFVFINDYSKWRSAISMEDSYSAAEFLVDNGWVEGYSSTPALTFFSDGKIEIWYVVKNTEKTDEEGNLKEFLYVKPWQQLMTHTSETAGNGGKTFLAIARSEYEDPFYVQRIDDGTLIFENDSWIIFGYESGDMLENELFDNDK